MNETHWIQQHLYLSNSEHFSAEAAAGLLPFAFAQQVLPNAQAVTATSVSQWGAAISSALAPLIDTPAPWRLHLVGLGNMQDSRRLQLIDEACDTWLKQKNRALRRLRVSDLAATWLPNEWCLQVVLVSPSEGFISLASSCMREPFGSTFSRYPGGRIEIPEDKRPPSRAYRKLLEAELHFGKSIQHNETCVDLGASPGGWTFVALERGATVTAVDRSPLRDDLMQHANLNFVRGDGFKYEPPQPVDWLLCDMIATADRSLGLIYDWLEHKRCKRLCVTVKFRGAVETQWLSACKNFLEQHASEYLVRQLRNNKHEITVCAENRLLF